MIRKLIQTLLTALLILAPQAVLPESDFLRVSATGNRQMTLSILAPLPLSGPADPKVASDIAAIFKQNMTMTGLFKVVMEEMGTVATNPDLLLKSNYISAGGAITFELRLVELPSGRELFAKRYSSSSQDLRRVIHTFSDEILNTLTGERGPFATKLAYVSAAGGNKEIYLMDWDGHNSRKLTTNGSINLYPDFSPSGKELIYTSYKNGKPDLYRRELFTGSEAKVTTAPGSNITAAFSPNGDSIALAMSKDGNSEIYQITKDGRELARLTRNPAIEISPAWSPDGNSIVFVSDRLGKPQIFIMKADGSDVRRLTMNGAYNVSPRWSPKGDKIVFCRRNGGDFNIFTINPDGSEERQLTTEGNNEYPRWSPDGRFIVYSSKRGSVSSLHVMRADGSGTLKISSAKESNPAWAPRW